MKVLFKLRERKQRINKNLKFNLFYSHFNEEKKERKIMKLRSRGGLRSSSVGLGLN